MKRLSLLAIALAITSVGSIGLFNSIVAAQADTNASGQALEIAPPVINLTAQPGEVITTQISLRDISNGSLVVSNEINDFTYDAEKEDGTPKIIFDEGETNPYSMKTWIEPLPSLTLESKELKQIQVTINVPADAAPGGYYSVVRFSGAAPSLDGTGVSLSASIGALLLVRVQGDVNEDLAIEEFSATKNGKSNWLFESVPIEFVERIKNNGSIHEQPSGQISITDMFGKTVATVNVNLPPRNILPSSIRKFEQPLDSSVIGNKVLFGKYTANLSLKYGADSETVTSSVTFWVIPYKLIGVAIIALIAGFFVLRHMIRRYNSHVIQKAQKPRRR